MSRDRIIELIQLYCLDEPCGGSLHIALADGNIDDGYIRWCMEEARKAGDHFGLALASLLLEITDEDERERVIQAGMERPARKYDEWDLIDEREACAKIAEDAGQPEIAARIRARHPAGFKREVIP